VDEFRRAINQVANQRISDDQLRPRLKIDAEVALEELDYDFFRQQERFEPCGLDNPKPVFVTRSVRILDTPRVVGRKHLKFTVTDGRGRQEAIWWNMADAGLPADKFDVAFHAELNEFRGTESVQLNVRDIDLRA
jgi:single-stranded-DNA-specific exonuclease